MVIFHCYVSSPEGSRSNVAPQSGQGNLGSFNAQLDARAEMGDIAGARGRLPGNANGHHLKRYAIDSGSLLSSSS